MNNVFLNDVIDQPTTMMRALNEYSKKDYMDVFKAVSKLSSSKVIFTGMGSSHYCSQGAVIELNQASITTRMESTSQILYYEQNAITEDTLQVLTSQSGESGEIVSLIEKLPRTQCVVGITNDPNSTLGRRANFLLPMQVASELAVSTRTYLSSLVLTNLLTHALLGKLDTSKYEKLQHAIEALSALLTEYKEISQCMEQFLGLPKFICLIGRGYSRSSVECGALFIKETAKFPSIALDSGEFRHGPYEMIDRDFCAILFAPEGKSCDMQIRLAQDIAALGGKSVLVTNRELDVNYNGIMTVRYNKVSEALTPLIDIVVPQLFANYVALQRGFAPGVFRQSHKITTTQ